MSNTVFVVGAGASKEVKLPTGAELKGKIMELLDFQPTGVWRSELTKGDPEIWEALNIHTNGKDRNSYRIAASAIIKALPQATSIDNFIYDRDDDKISLCGKLAIVKSILQAEKNSRLFFEKSNAESNINFNNLQITGYTPFFRSLIQDCNKKDKLKERFKSITLIIFNYDRCIEHFIYNGLKNYYDFSDVEAAELVKEIKIFHPYGDVGTLPWIDGTGAIDFGVEPGAPILLDLAKNIKTFKEGTDSNSSKIEEIRKKMGAADRLVFLGFDFHDINMQLITPLHLGNKEIQNIKCFATAFDRSKSDIEIIRGQIIGLYQSNHRYRDQISMEIEDYVCSQFFEKFRTSLAF